MEQNIFFLDPYKMSLDTFFMALEVWKFWPLVLVLKIFKKFLFFSSAADFFYVLGIDTWYPNMFLLIQPKVN